MAVSKISIRVRLTEDEHERIRQYAEASKLTESAIVRMIVAMGVDAARREGGFRIPLEETKKAPGDAPEPQEKKTRKKA